MWSWLFLATAIGFEIAGTLLLRSAATNPRAWTFLLVAIAYVTSFAALAVALRTLNVGVAYAIWSAVGTAVVAVLGSVIFDDRISVAATVGLALIVAGVIVLVAAGGAHHA